MKPKDEGSLDNLLRQLQSSGGEEGPGDAGASQVFAAPGRDSSGPRWGQDAGGNANCEPQAKEGISSEPSRTEGDARRREAKAGGDAGEFTRIFTQLPMPGAPRTAGSAGSASADSREIRPEGEFTQLFEGVRATPRPGPASPRESASDSKRGEFTSFFKPRGEASSSPATESREVSSFESNPVSRERGAAAASAGTSGGVTELLRALGTPSPSPATAVSASSERFVAPATESPAPSNAGAASTGGAGEFTSMMQKLQSEEAQSLPARAETGAGRNLSTGAGGPGEFTRIVEGSAARMSSAAAPAFAPAKAATPAGLSIGTPAISKPPAEAPPMTGRRPLEKWVPWLLILNTLLLAGILALLLLPLLRHAGR